MDRHSVERRNPFIQRLTRKYAVNGSAIARQIENGFFYDARHIPAEIIADNLARISNSDLIFNVARELERASSSERLLPLDALSIETKSLLGVILDFNEKSRERVAEAWTYPIQGQHKTSLITPNAMLPDLLTEVIIETDDAKIKNGR